MDPLNKSGLVCRKAAVKILYQNRTLGNYDLPSYNTALI